MALNTNPIFSGKPHIEWVGAIVSSANTAKDGTGTVQTIFVADNTNGSYVSFIRLTPIGTNVASVARIFINNGLTNATPANNIQIANATLPATTISEVAAQNPIEIPINMALPAGYKLNITLGTAVDAGFSVVAVGGDYTIVS